MKKIMVVLLVAMVGVAFGGKFEKSEYDKFIKAKDYAGLKTYITNNSQYGKDNKYFFVLAQLMVKANVDKTLTKSNVATQIPIICKQYGYIDNSIVSFLFNARQFFTGNMTIKQSALLAKNYYIDKKMTVYIPSMINVYITLEEYDNCINYIKGFTVNDEKKDTFLPLYASYKKLTVAQKLDLIKVITSDDKLTMYVVSAKDLNYIVEMVKTLNDPKYDEVIKPFILKLYRTFYNDNIQDSKWKQAVINLKFVMVSYGLQ